MSYFLYTGETQKFALPVELSGKNIHKAVSSIVLFYKFALRQILKLAI